MISDFGVVLKFGDPSQMYYRYLNFQYGDMKPEPAKNSSTINDY